jgi:hypothetical protein
MKTLNQESRNQRQKQKFNSGKVGGGHSGAMFGIFPQYHLADIWGQLFYRSFWQVVKM